MAWAVNRAFFRPPSRAPMHFTKSNDSLAPAPYHPSPASSIRYPFLGSFYDSTAVSLTHSLSLSHSRSHRTRLFLRSYLPFFCFFFFCSFSKFIMRPRKQHKMLTSCGENFIARNNKLPLIMQFAIKNLLSTEQMSSLIFCVFLFFRFVEAEVNQSFVNGWNARVEYIETDLNRILTV